MASILTQQYVSCVFTPLCLSLLLYSFVARESALSPGIQCMHTYISGLGNNTIHALHRILHKAQNFSYRYTHTSEGLRTRISSCIIIVIPCSYWVGYSYDAMHALLATAKLVQLDGCKISYHQSSGQPNCYQLCMCHCGSSVLFLVQ